MSTTEMLETEGSPRLLARYAESILWLARYMERIENVARILDITQTFAGDESGGRNWTNILRINSDEWRFRAAHGEPDARSVAKFYLLDRENPTSIPVAIDRVRENARTLRALISTEMWLHINVFSQAIRGMSPADIAPDNLSHLCAMLRAGCQAHGGITEGTFYRDQAWAFYELGRHLERADQTTRLLDIGFTMLVATPGEGTQADAAQWAALLRAASGYHAFRRVHPGDFAPEKVLGFLLLDGGFPRSVGLNLSQIEWHLTRLRTHHDLRHAAAPLERVSDLRAALEQARMQTLIEHGVSGFLDGVQRTLGQLQNDIAKAFYAAG